ncbi:MAG TPA: cytochrome c biogenesis protein DipZ [Bryobacteraceae bacterium]|jgi:cytochrome c biogenesis protein CcdA/thiol-disulfide isomerase/thioredoxin
MNNLLALFVLAFLGGVLTIVSPCILPVLPFVFSKADQPFRRSGLPLLAGMAATFAAFAAVATVGGGWIVRANQYGRIAAMAVLAIFGLTLLWEPLADWLSRPLVRLGSRLSSPQAGHDKPSASRSLVLGVATGLLWAPCAGPILGLILTGAAVEGAGSNTAILLLTYAVGAATSLAVALLAGGRVFSALKRSLGAEVWIRRVLGVAVLAGVALVAFGLDRGLLTQISLSSTSGVEQTLVDRLQPKKKEGPAMMMMSAASGGKGAGLETLPELSGVAQWFNSPPLSRDGLKGHVVLVDFWTYSCINCLRTLPFIRAWADRYKNNGLVVLGVHTPEFAFEKNPANVREALKEFHVTYPVALDNDYAIWKAFNNQYWPADYLVDATGKVRFHHFGEGKYDETENHIQELLKETNKEISFNGDTKVTGTGTEAPPDSDVQSPETYVGFERGDSFLSPGGFVHDAAHTYTVPEHLELNQWGFSGNWTDGPQTATLNAVPGTIVFRFHARDVHLVLGPAASGAPVHFRVKLDGKAPGVNHGIDTDEQGSGIVSEHRLYQLIRQKGTIDDSTFEIDFLDPGVEAFAFTFG